MQKKAYEIKVEGLVQGVGFRPFVYRIALDSKLSGWVRNASDGLYIRIQGDESKLKEFVRALKSDAPIASRIDKVIITESPVDTKSEFIIHKSRDETDEITQVSPDIAVCDDCLNDLRLQPHRLNYPFINCTHCGPRFTIIRDLPYDRERTSMDIFQMCDECRREYEDILDRRFHAQPVACTHCGPHYSLVWNGGKSENLDEIIAQLSDLMDKGGIAAIKGMGGFFIMCDALNERAVERLRKSKYREGKPFAVMFRNLAKAGEFAFLSESEKQMLISWQRPIVLVKARKSLAPSVCMGFPTIGAMLPYMPFHYLLFKRLKQDVLVLTSGNLSEEPIIIDNQQAHEILGRITDAVLTYNRDIHNRADDSVGMVINNKPRLIRRSRGFAPSPVNLEFDAEGILATGAELSNCFCIGKGRQAILSQHIGDLKNFETYVFYTEAAERLNKLFRVKPSVVAFDLHPDYLSTSYAMQLNLPSIGIQHHHAHIASCMAENGLNEKVIGVAFDGTGYGMDGTTWGSEFLVCDLAVFERKQHLAYIALPGGDSVTKEPWRTGLSALYKIFGGEVKSLDIPFIRNLKRNKLQLIIENIEKNINCPLSCSAGRWFDAVAAITEICMESSFHAEAPMRLEAVLDESERGNYPWNYNEQDEITMDAMIHALIEDIRGNTSLSIISARFHNTLLEIIIETIFRISQETGLKKAVFSGGTFQNRYLLARLENIYARSDIKIYTQCQVPSNDGGIALGQLAIAAARRSEGI